jgi:prephenate dehydrogenase
MWRGILLGNAVAVVPALRDLVAETTRLMEMVEAGDGSGLESMLREAKALRRMRYPD